MKATTLIAVVLAVLLSVGAQGEPANCEDTAMCFAGLRDQDVLALTARISGSSAERPGAYLFSVDGQEGGVLAVEVLNGKRFVSYLRHTSAGAQLRPYASVSSMYSKVWSLYGKGTWFKEEPNRPYCYQTLTVQRCVRPEDRMVLEVKYLDQWPVWLMEVAVIRWPEGEGDK